MDIAVAHESPHLASRHGNRPQPALFSLPSEGVAQQNPWNSSKQARWDASQQTSKRGPLKGSVRLDSGLAGHGFHVKTFVPQAINFPPAPLIRQTGQRANTNTPASSVRDLFGVPKSVTLHRPVCHLSSQWIKLGHLEEPGT